MGLAEYSFVIILQKVKSISGRACSFAHLKDSEGGNSPRVYRGRKVNKQPGPVCNSSIPKNTNLGESQEQIQIFWGGTKESVWVWRSPASESIYLAPRMKKLFPQDEAENQARQTANRRDRCVCGWVDGGKIDV